jgi:hypothetical protein
VSVGLKLFMALAILFTGLLPMFGCQATAMVKEPDRSSLWVHSRINVPLLRPGFTMGRVSTGAIGVPVIYSLRVAVWDPRGKRVSLAHSFIDILAFVGPIESRAQALELVRLYTRYPDFLMFDDNLLDIDLATAHIRLPDTLAGKLPPVQVEDTHYGGYRLKRNLVKYDRRSGDLIAFRSEETLEQNGSYKIRISRVYRSKPGDLSIFLPE